MNEPDRREIRELCQLGSARILSVKLAKNICKIFVFDEKKGALLDNCKVV